MCTDDTDELSSVESDFSALPAIENKVDTMSN